MLGLWVTDIGAASGSGAQATVRLEQGYSAVAVEAGHGFVRASRRKSPVTAGEVCLCVCETPVEFVPAAEWELRWISWDGPEADELESLGYMPTHRGPIPGAASCIGRAFFAMSDLAECDLTSAPLERKAVVLTLLGELLRAARRRHESLTPEGRLTAALQYLNSHYLEEVRPDRIAELLNTSPSHFRRLFRRRTGLSVVRYVTGLRMRKAMHLLIEGHRVKETAYLCGFHDEYYFTRVFHRAVGTSPTAFVRGYHVDHGGREGSDGRWRQHYVNSLIRLPC